MWTPFSSLEPRWMRDLDLTPTVRAKVRERATAMRLNDMHPSPPGSRDEHLRRLRLRLRLAGRWRFSVVGALLAAAPITIMLAVPFSSFGGAGWSLIAARIIGLMVAAQLVAAVIVQRWLMSQVLTPYFATALREHGIVVCLKCGYPAANDARSTVCPECGLDDPLARDDAST
jgi:hypothetical protein